MRIGGKENFLSIEGGPRDGIIFLRLEAGAGYDEQRFTARVWTLADWNSQKRKEFAEFEDFKTTEFEMRFVADGWLRLKRDHRGWIAVRYHITSPRAPARTAMEGEVWVEGEFAGSFCGELRALLDAAN